MTSKILGKGNGGASAFTKKKHEQVQLFISVTLSRTLLLSCCTKNAYSTNVVRKSTNYTLQGCKVRRFRAHGLFP